MSDNSSKSLDAEVAQALKKSQTSESILPLLKIEIQSKILLRRHDGQIKEQEAEKSAPKMTKSEIEKREIVRKRNIHHAKMSRVRKKNKEQALLKTVARGQKEVARLMRESELLRAQKETLKDMLENHNCILK